MVAQFRAVLAERLFTVIAFFVRISITLYFFLACFIIDNILFYLCVGTLLRLAILAVSAIPAIIRAITILAACYAAFTVISITMFTSRAASRAGAPAAIAPVTSFAAITIISTTGRTTISTLGTDTAVTVILHPALTKVVPAHSIFAGFASILAIFANFHVTAL